MTYRLIPPRVWSQLQFILLGLTVLIGITISLAPPDTDSRLGAIEQFMNVDLWAFTLIAAALAGAAMEYDMKRRDHERWINAVGYTHIVMCSLMIGYGASAISGVLTRTWWNIAAPGIAFFLAYLHYIYIRRRPRAHR